MGAAAAAAERHRAREAGRRSDAAAPPTRKVTTRDMSAMTASAAAGGAKDAGATTATTTTTTRFTIALSIARSSSLARSRVARSRIDPSIRIRPAAQRTRKRPDRPSRGLGFRNQCIESMRARIRDARARARVRRVRVGACDARCTGSGGDRLLTRRVRRVRRVRVGRPRRMRVGGWSACVQSAGRWMGARTACEWR